MHTIKITPNLLFECQCTSGKFIRLPNRIEKKIDSVARIESKFFLPELKCSSLQSTCCEHVALCAIVKGDNTSSSSSTSSSAAAHSPTSRWRDSTSLDATSEQERTWRSAACDYELRFCGHCNTTTDIKEANFFGRLDNFL